MSLWSKSKAEDFERLVAPLERQVYFTCLGIMGKKEDAEDCAQEAMLKAYRKLHTFKGEAKLTTWLYAIATRVCLDALRKRRELLSLEALQGDGFEPGTDAEEAYLKLEDSQRKALLRQAIAQLPGDFRTALVLVDLQGLSYQEAAQVLDVPEGTVKSRISRARKALQKILLKNRELFSDPPRPNDERRDDDDL